MATPPPEMLGVLLHAFIFSAAKVFGNQKTTVRILTFHRVEMMKFSCWQQGAGKISNVAKIKNHVIGSSCWRLSGYRL
jgi:hypothetical protein